MITILTVGHYYAGNWSGLASPSPQNDTECHAIDLQGNSTSLLFLSIPITFIRLDQSQTDDDTLSRYICLFPCICARVSLGLKVVGFDGFGSGDLG